MGKIRKYFIFEDYLKQLKVSGATYVDVKYYANNLKTILNNLYSSEYILIDSADPRMLVAKFQGGNISVDYLYPVLNELILRYSKEGISWIDFDPITEAEPTNPYSVTSMSSYYKLSDAFRDFTSKLLEVYFETLDRYKTLIDLYNNQTSHLLDQINSKTVMRFNDTPQNGGDWSDDGHTTNITQNETNTDVLPLMDRLNTIQNSYRNLIREWADEFKGLFFIIPEDEYDE